MVQEKQAGLKMYAGEEKGHQKCQQDHITEAVLTLLLYLSVCGVAYSMMQAKTWWFFTLPGILVLMICLFLKGKKKYFWVVEALAWAAFALFMLIKGNRVTEGCRLLVNQLFAESESCQAYLYDKFPVTASGMEAEACIRSAILVVSLLLASLLPVLGRRMRAAAGVSLFALSVLLAAYYGVMPAAVWIFLLLLSAALSASRSAGHTAAGFCRSAGMIFALAVIVAGLTLWLSPAENIRISEIDEQLRDVLAFHTANIVNTSQRAEEQQEESLEEEQKPEDSGAGSQSDISRNWRKFLFILLVILLVLLLLFLPAFFLDHLAKKRGENRKGLDSEDCAEAIRAMFLYLRKWLLAAGIKLENKPYGFCAEQMESRMPAYAEEYRDILRLWQEAAFSEHIMLPEQRERMRLFMQKTVELVWSEASYGERLKIKYQYAL